MPARVPLFAAAVALCASVHALVALRCHVPNFVAAIALPWSLLQELDPYRHKAHQKAAPVDHLLRRLYWATDPCRPDAGVVLADLADLDRFHGASPGFGDYASQFVGSDGIVQTGDPEVGTLFRPGDRHSLADDLLDAPCQRVRLLLIIGTGQLQPPRACLGDLIAGLHCHFGYNAVGLYSSENLRICPRTPRQQRQLHRRCPGQTQLRRFRLFFSCSRRTCRCLLLFFAPFRDRGPGLLRLCYRLRCRTSCR
ncbi:unnamed protein product [Euphydryas editha]|uniref:Uncharacterized protein n=1 Tax=Euphydryas editha TaxID=104508 RepID=A0AAU9V9B1_EUPED|nr:unnamed protein product [Euphydryas editha]